MRGTRTPEGSTPPATPPPVASTKHALDRGACVGASVLAPLGVVALGAAGCGSTAGLPGALSAQSPYPVRGLPAPDAVLDGRRCIAASSARTTASWPAADAMSMGSSPCTDLGSYQRHRASRSTSQLREQARERSSLHIARQAHYAGKPTAALVTPRSLGWESKGCRAPVGWTRGSHEARGSSGPRTVPTPRTRIAGAAPRPLVGHPLRRGEGVCGPRHCPRPQQLQPPTETQRSGCLRFQGGVARASRGGGTNARERNSKGVG